MDYEAWQVKRRELMEREKSERNANWQQSRPPIQASVNEQAIRELYGMVDELRERFSRLGDGTRQVLDEMVTATAKQPETLHRTATGPEVRAAWRAKKDAEKSEAE